MRKDIGVKPAVFPMPVLMIGTYDENGKVDVMNMAWGGICGENMVALNISESHKTVKNMKQTKAFTLAIADRDHMAESDFFGIASGNDMEDKFERSGLTATKSNFVNAPVIEEYPLTMECEVLEFQTNQPSGYRIIGEIKNVSVDEKVLDENGKVDPAKLNAFVFDQFQNGYYAIGEKIGKAWNAGAGLMKK